MDDEGGGGGGGAEGAGGGSVGVGDNASMGEGGDGRTEAGREGEEGGEVPELVRWPFYHTSVSRHTVDYTFDLPNPQSIINRPCCMQYRRDTRGDSRVRSRTFDQNGPNVPR